MSSQPFLYLPSWRGRRVRESEYYHTNLRHSMQSFIHLFHSIVLSTRSILIIAVELRQSEGPQARKYSRPKVAFPSIYMLCAASNAGRPPRVQARNNRARQWMRGKTRDTTVLHR